MAFANATPAQIAALTPGYDVILSPTDPASANPQITQSFGAKTIADLSIDYRATEKITLTIGSNNLFDVYPDKNIASTPATVAAGANGSDNAGIFPYNYVSPFGWNGRYVFAKVAVKM